MLLLRPVFYLGTVLPSNVAFTSYEASLKLQLKLQREMNPSEEMESQVTFK